VDTARIAEREANQRLRELDRMKDEFVSTISHELRTPLTSITGYVELAREQADPKTDAYLAVVDRNASRLLSLVNHLLFVARLQSGRLDLEYEHVDVTSLVAESVAAAKPQAAGAKVELRLHLTEDETAVRGDRRRLAQVVDNLLSNAIKFSPEAGTVELTVARGDGRGMIRGGGYRGGVSRGGPERLLAAFFRTPGPPGRPRPGAGRWP